MTEYHIYVDRDNDVWLRKGCKIQVYAYIDNLLENPESLDGETICDIASVINQWELQLLSQGNDLQIIAYEAKLELLLRQ